MTEKHHESRPLESAERFFHFAVSDIRTAAELVFKDTPQAGVIPKAYQEIIGTLRVHTEETDEGDRRLLKAYGAFLEEVAKELKAL